MTNRKDEIPLDELEFYTDEHYPIQVPIGFELDLSEEKFDQKEFYRFLCLQV